MDVSVSAGTGRRTGAVPKRVPCILIVDDDRATLSALSETLRLRLGPVAVHTAPSTDAALELLDSMKPHVILSDVLMPGRDGMALMRAARRLYPDVPVILMTGVVVVGEQPDPGDAFACLEKPLDVRRLTSVLRKALKAAGSNRLRQPNQTSVLELLELTHPPQHAL